MSSELTELGQEAIAAVSKGVADGAPLVKCQLLASTFYEALRHELRKAEASKRGELLAVTDQCHRSAAANISPLRALVELKRAVDLLRAVTPVALSEPPPRPPPVLRVIQGARRKASATCFLSFRLHRINPTTIRWSIVLSPWERWARYAIWRIVLITC